ncbi:hypothetical protein B0H11DRAFT_2183230, partial [Mycena galericulata]
MSLPPDSHGPWTVPIIADEAVSPSRTAIDTGRFDADGEDTIGEFGDDTIQNMPPVTVYQGTVSDSQIMDQEVGPTYAQLLDLPTFQPRRQMADGSAVLARRDACISEAITALNKPHLANCRTASRRMHYHVFKDELNALESLLYRVERNEGRLDDRGGVSFTVFGVYRFEASAFQHLMELLEGRRVQAATTFTIKGKRLPSLPILGTDGVVSSWRRENDFEIVGVCFRLEVEDFLVQLDSEYDFLKGKGRKVETFPPENILPTTNEPAPLRDAPPHLTAHALHVVRPIQGETSEVRQILPNPVQINKPLMSGIPDIRRTHASAMYNAEPGPSRATDSAWIPRGIGISTGNRRMNELLLPVASRYATEEPNDSVSHGHAAHASKMAQLWKAAGLADFKGTATHGADVSSASRAAPQWPQYHYSNSGDEPAPAYHPQSSDTPRNPFRPVSTSSPQDHSPSSSRTSEREPPRRYSVVYQGGYAPVDRTNVPYTAPSPNPESGTNQ